MSMTTQFHFPTRTRLVRAGLMPVQRGRILRPLAAIGLVVALAFGAEQAVQALQTPGQAIRGDLRDAASQARRLSYMATPAEVQEAIQPSFAGYDATVDARGFPTSVSVTLHGLDRDACIGAVSAAQRMEGSVVVNLLGYPTAAQCRERNDMTWRIMP
jgi:hypothetical protein